MGFFSWKTSDTKRSIANTHSSRPTFTVYALWPDGSYLEEAHYDGYGRFGGCDIYEEIAYRNGLSERSQDENIMHEARLKALSAVFRDNPSGDFAVAAENGLIVPKFSTKIVDYSSLPHSENCPYQGYFYPFGNDEFAEECSEDQAISDEPIHAK